MSEILKEVVLGIMFATPLGLALLIGILWLIRAAWRWCRMWRLARADAADTWEPEDAEWEEVVYR